MAKYSEQDRRTVIGWFPNLQHDANFEITSDCTPAYNCIAWALGMNDVWVGLDHPSNYSWAWWPEEVPCDERTESLVALFEHFGLRLPTIPPQRMSMTKLLSMLTKKDGHMPQG